MYASTENVTLFEKDTIGREEHSEGSPSSRGRAQKRKRARLRHSPSMQHEPPGTTPHGCARRGEKPNRAIPRHDAHGRSIWVRAEGGKYSRLCGGRHVVVSCMEVWMYWTTTWGPSAPFVCGSVDVVVELRD